MARSARTSTSGWALTLALVLTGCGGGSASQPEASASARPDGAPAPFPAIGAGAQEGEVGAEGLSLEDVEAMRDLADAAEQLAGQQPTIAARDGSPVLGGDISWPQCPRGLGIPQRRTLGLPMPTPDMEYVVVGLTNGPGFYPNPCLAEQVAWVRERGLLLSAYAVLSYPDDQALEQFGDDGPHDGASVLGALRNVGYQQALYNIRSMRAVGLDTPLVWLDVEPVALFEWSGDPVANAAVVEGARRGYEDAGYRVGVYSTPYLWEQIVGDLALDVPEWRAAGETSRAEALERCGADWSIQGGEPVLGQWLEASRDHNVTCPGISRDLGRWFSATRGATDG